MKVSKAIDIGKIIAIEIKKRRLKLGFSQEQLSVKTGLYKSSIKYLEQGKANPSVFTLYKISVALKTSIEVLLKKM